MIHKHWRLLLPFAALLAVLAVFTACGDDDDGGASEEEIAEFEALVTQLVESGPDDVDFFLDHITPEALAIFGFESEEECRAAPDDCVGDPGEVESITDTEISGDEASTTVTTSDDDGTVLNLLFVNEDDTWKVQGIAFTAAIPEGVTVIDVAAVDYGFEWDSGEVEDGNVAFAMTNEGEEVHEMAVAMVNEDFDIEEVIAGIESGEDSEEDNPPGVEDFVGFGFGSPGTTSNVVFEAELEPGNYVMLCTIPNDEGDPHVTLGMHSEFTVPE